MTVKEETITCNIILATYTNWADAQIHLPGYLSNLKI